MTLEDKVDELREDVNIEIQIASDSNTDLVDTYSCRIQFTLTVKARDKEEAMDKISSQLDLTNFASLLKGHAGEIADAMMKCKQSSPRNLK